MRLQELSDKELHFKTLELVYREREATAKILHHLNEIDRRKLFSDFRCSSLFDYCVRLLGYSDSSAQRRIIAARLLTEVPEIENKIVSGQLTLTNISMANQYLKEAPERKREVLRAIENLSKKECERKLFELFGRELPPREGQKRISKDKVQVTFIVSNETLEEVERLRDLLGRFLTMDEVLKYMATAGIEKVERTKFKQTKERISLPPAAVKRTPSASVKREVYRRDRKCQQCGSVHNLNFDHRIPFALHGPTTTENMRLLCFHCNQRARIKIFGMGPNFRKHSNDTNPRAGP